jgi:rare lipoprotein A (peptidoglycan hydrolase)
MRFPLSVKKKRLQPWFDLLLSLTAGVAVGGLGYAQMRAGRADLRLDVSLPSAPETGIASWYGEPYHGRRTANGELYDMHLLTAAHRTMPLPSYVRVTNLLNNRSVIVRVNDRGPFIAGRILDVSFGAAQALGMVQQGLAKVRIEPALPPQEASP